MNTNISTSESDVKESKDFQINTNKRGIKRHRLEDVEESNSKRPCQIPISTPATKSTRSYHKNIANDRLKALREKIKKDVVQFATVPKSKVINPCATTFKNAQKSNCPSELIHSKLFVFEEGSPTKTFVNSNGNSRKVISSPGHDERLGTKLPNTKNDRLDVSHNSHLLQFNVPEIKNASIPSASLEYKSKVAATSEIVSIKKKSKGKNIANSRLQKLKVTLNEDARRNKRQSRKPIHTTPSPEYDGNALSPKNCFAIKDESKNESLPRNNDCGNFLNFSFNKEYSKVTNFKDKNSGGSPLFSNTKKVPDENSEPVTVDNSGTNKDLICKQPFNKSTSVVKLDNSITPPDFQNIPLQNTPILFNRIDESSTSSQNLLNVIPQKLEIESMDVDEASNDGIFKEQDEKSDPKENKIEKVCIVVDTNVFLHHLNILAEIIKIKENHCSLPPILYVPWMVINELDYMKDDKAASTLKTKSQSAIKFINMGLLTMSERLIGQNAYDASEQPSIGSSPDDKILSCCLQIATKYTKVILLSSDVNMKNKAIINGVKTCSPNEILLKLKSNDKYEVKVNKILEKMSLCCSYVMCEAAKDAYGDIWKQMDMLQNPPWSLADCLKRFQKYWISIFSAVLLKQCAKAIENLKEILKYRDHYKNEEDFKNFCKSCISLCIYLKDFQIVRGTVENTIKEIIQIKDL